MAGNCTKLIMLVILCFSYLICMNEAIPVTRSTNLVQKPLIHEAAKRVLMEKGEDIVMRRMEMEVNDYPGSGANNRHTPRSQLGRSGCIDC